MLNVMFNIFNKYKQGIYTFDQMVKAITKYPTAKDEFILIEKNDGTQKIEMKTYVLDVGESLGSLENLPAETDKIKDLEGRLALAEQALLDVMLMGVGTDV